MAGGRGRRDHIPSAIGGRISPRLVMGPAAGRLQYFLYPNLRRLHDDDGGGHAYWTTQRPVDVILVPLSPFNQLSQ